MYIETVPNRNSPPCTLLRESWREDGKIKKRTVANLTDLDPQIVEGLKLLLKGGVAVELAEDAMEIRRSLPHGHVALVLQAMRKLGFADLLSRKDCRERDLCIALIAARILHSASWEVIPKDRTQYRTTRINQNPDNYGVLSFLPLEVQLSPGSGMISASGNYQIPDQNIDYYSVPKCPGGGN